MLKSFNKNETNYIQLLNKGVLLVGLHIKRICLYSYFHFDPPFIHLYLRWLHLSDAVARPLVIATHIRGWVVHIALSVRLPATEIREDLFYAARARQDIVQPRAVLLVFFAPLVAPSHWPIPVMRIALPVGQVIVVHPSLPILAVHLLLVLVVVARSRVAVYFSSVLVVFSHRLM